MAASLACAYLSLSSRSICCPTSRSSDCYTARSLRCSSSRTDLPMPDEMTSASLRRLLAPLLHFTIRSSVSANWGVTSKFATNFGTNLPCLDVSPTCVCRSLHKYRQCYQFGRHIAYSGTFVMPGRAKKANRQSRYICLAQKGWLLGLSDCCL